MTRPRVDAATVRACCAAAYGHDAVALLLGESYHPGGLALTRRIADQIGLRPGHRVADVACGPGTTARLLAAEYQARVDGVDLNPSTVDAPGIRFHTGDAEQIPLPGMRFDAVVCECAFCTFSDKPAAAREFARLLRPGGRLGLTDVTVEGSLPGELRGLTAWVACIADARPLRAYLQLLSDAGLRITHHERHDAAIIPMLDQIEARLTLLRSVGAGWLAAAQIEASAIAGYLDVVRQAVADRVIGYALIVAEKPRPARDGREGPDPAHLT
jgi:ubiquinone/menaquinone biosynthesis C-methylase UbiE